MTKATAPLWAVQPTFRLDRADPYLLLQHVTLFVRDQDRSLSFFVDLLGFLAVLDYRAPEGVSEWSVGGRWVMVAPPDGTARVALVAPTPDSEEYPYIGQSRQIVFITDDVERKYKEWHHRGVHFLHPPQTGPFGSKFTRFEDADGNRFALTEFDQASREVEEQRRRAEEQMEAERRAARELEIAREVQARLFPQIFPASVTLEYAGRCIQARQVGGDYFDFLELGGNRLGLVIGDIAGKGIAAALLMANLQANLRSQCATASDQPHQFLQLVNRSFYRSTAVADYATIFFAEYDDQTQRLSYSNCGHVPALLLRRDDAVEWLASTSTVVGLFEDWECFLDERQLMPGDTLVLYTDGITESLDDAGEEFGEERLIEVLRRHRGLSPHDLITAIFEEVRRFHPHEQHDDITLIVAHCRDVSA